METLPEYTAKGLQILAWGKKSGMKPLFLPFAEKYGSGTISIHLVVWI
jgi:hypothetical protein